MTARWYLSTAAGTAVEITDRVRLPVDPEGVAIAVGAQANAGAGWEGDLLVDDQAGNLIPLMDRRIYCVQDAAPAGGQVVGNWFISNLKIKAMDPWNGIARMWTITMADENSLLSRRKFVGTDSNRPAETDIERLRWFLTTTEGNVFDPDEDFIDTANPVDLDAADLRQQGPDEMMDSLMKASGKQYGVMYREDLGAYVIWYFNQNTSTLYESTVKLSNVASEIGDPTSTLVYPLSGDAELDRAGGRMASGMLGKYKNNWLYIQNTSVGDAYAYVDRVASDINVSSLAKATTEFTRQLRELDIPDDEITTTLTVEEDDLNLVMHGMRIQVHASHFPNYTDDTDPSVPGYLQPGYAADYVWCRVIERTVRQLGPTTFELPLRLSPQTTGTLDMARLIHVGERGVEACGWFFCSGVGWLYNPLTWLEPDPILPTPVSFDYVDSAGSTGARYSAIECLANGNVNIRAVWDWNDVVLSGTRTFRCAIELNGTIIEYQDVSHTGFGMWHGDADVNATGVAVVIGDLISASITSNQMAYPAIPAGTGDVPNYLQVVGA